MKNYASLGWPLVVGMLVAVLILTIVEQPATAKKDHGKSNEKVIPGIEVFLEKHVDWVKDKRVGLITNPTGVDREMQSDINLLFNNSNVNLTALFGPEHGIRGDREAGEYVESYVDEQTGLPVYSLYGPTWQPTEEMLEDVDVLLFDIQDIGSNVYTYIYTLGFAMEAAAQYDKELIVLDRPNAAGGDKVEGPVRDPGTVSFMGRFLLPVRHGMTVGELATMWNHEYSLGIGLKVAQMSGWERTMHYEDTGLPWVQPSPNIPTPTSADLYAGTELVEDTNLTTGLGTTKPFELLGAPWIDADVLAAELNSRDIAGLRFRPAHFTPEFSKYKGELVSGVQVHIDDSHEIDLVALGLHLIDAMRDQDPENFSIDASYGQLIGDPDVRKMIVDGRPVDEIMESWQEELEAWKNNVRNKYLLYPPYPDDGEPYEKQSVLGILPLDVETSPGEEIDLTVHGVDEQGVKLDVDQNEVKWQVEGGIGIVENGMFIPDKQGEGKLTASYNGLSTERKVTVDQNIINNIRHAAHSNYTRVVFDLNKNTDYEIGETKGKLILKVPHTLKGDELEESGVVNIQNSPVVSKNDYRFEAEAFIAEIQLKEESVAFETPSFSDRIVIDVMH
ncbi:uncharacterized protein YbbC (DUF1343 family) [Virgibacillus halotolerans]|uniref:exo-beta-N-acetylmuramidase NamZ family protein n=1 Tax=Virgibacillus halotolerans TaxID=1071053 RepID=UPI0019610083|nr:exo-beta-N-acetylmuramidase NamZ domain-containing protein [Virgibacillus halotolerans]MBM7601921.1 uncharacterized protein YbbC (DUF1343 family) [Virgibacillus halotolerans]